MRRGSTYIMHKINKYLFINISTNLVLTIIIEWQVYL